MYYVLKELHFRILLSAKLKGEQGPYLPSEKGNMSLKLEYEPRAVQPCPKNFRALISLIIYYALGGFYFMLKLLAKFKGELI